MKDLRDAILDVLDSASEEGCDGLQVVDHRSLWVLQEQFNIYFREMHEHQECGVERPPD